MSLLPLLFGLFRRLLAPRLELVVENLALRQQLTVLNRTTKRPKLRSQDRLFWPALSSLWKKRHETRGDQRSMPKSVNSSAECLKRILCEAYHGFRLTELNLLGFNVAESTVAKYRVRAPRPPSQTWKTFLSNHAGDIVGIDFFTVPSLTFRNFYCFIILLHDRRTIVYFNVTDHPTAAWTAQQMIEAFPDDTSPRFLLRDRDSIYGEEFRSRVKGMRIEEVITVARSPWQNPFAERLIGSIRREYLDHLIVINEDHLRRILRSYIDYYHNFRPHQGLEGNPPAPREIDPPANGRVIASPQVGGLHHSYRRAA